MVELSLFFICQFLFFSPLAKFETTFLNDLLYPYFPLLSLRSKAFHYKNYIEA